MLDSHGDRMAIAPNDNDQKGMLREAMDGFSAGTSSGRFFFDFCDDCHRIQKATNQTIANSHDNQMRSEDPERRSERMLSEARLANK
jgi:hypothetical protein